MALTAPLIAPKPPAVRTAPSSQVKNALVPVDPVKKRILMVLPENGFDATESSGPWKMLKAAGHEVVFATASGREAKVDPFTLDGRPVSGGVQGFFGEQFLNNVQATPEAKQIFQEMAADPAFKRPIKFSQIDPKEFDGAVIPGGEGPGMIPFLDDATLQKKVADFFVADKPVAALCHGVLVAARATDPRTGKSVLFDKKTSGTPKYMERAARVGFHLAGRDRVYDVYETTKAHPVWAEDEIKSVLKNPKQYKGDELHTVTLQKGTLASDRHTLVVRDGNYVSARWPGDSFAFGKGFVALLREKKTSVLAP